MLLFITTLLALSLPADPAPAVKVEVLTFPVDRSAVEVTNTFSTLNPFYKQRAGAFYDTEYVSVSASKLFRLANVEPPQMIGVLDILRGFAFDYLDFYVRGDGNITMSNGLSA